MFFFYTGIHKNICFENSERVLIKKKKKDEVLQKDLENTKDGKYEPQGIKENWNKKETYSSNQK